MYWRFKKRCLRSKVISLTCIFFLLTVYLHIYVYLPVTETKPRIRNMIDKRREVEIRWNIHHDAALPTLKEKLDEVMVKGWEVNISRNTRQYVFPDDVTTIINVRNIATDLFLVVMVCSAPANFELRSAIRDTWASLADSSTRVIFLLGKTGNSTLQDRILQESGMYDDIIQERFVDSYNNLTIKSVMMLKWMLQHSSARFLMKSDDDVYVNLPALSKLLRPVAKRKNTLFGNLICKAPPYRNSTHKWYTSYYIYNEPYFPNFLVGSGYVMSQDVVPKLYHAALSTPIVHMEDVFITGICARVAGVRPLYTYGFSLEGRKLSDACDPTFFTTHHLYPEDLRTVFSYVNKCPPPTPHSPHYRTKHRPAFIPWCLKSIRR